MLKARIADGLSSLRSLRRDWEQLHADGNGGLFQSFAWMEAWATAIEGLGQGDVRVLVVEDTACRCIVPLIVQHRMGVRRLRWLGVEVTDYCDVVAADLADIGALGACIREHLPPADMVELSQIRAGSLASRIFGASPPVEAGQSCPRIAVADGNLPKEILYAERRAAGAGELRHHVATDTPERQAVVTFVVAQKRLSLLRQGIKTVEFDQRVTPFLLSLVDLAYPAGSRPYFSWLTLDGQTIAAQVGFIENRTLLYYLPAYDAAFRQHSPGHLSLLNLVRDAARLELETVDLLRGQEPYKFKWTSVQQPLSAAEWAVTWQGRAFTFARRFASGQAR